MPVADSVTPILFTLPRVSLDAESQAMCTYWDAATQSYPTHGCIGVPNPQPPGHTLAFVPGYQTPDDASLAMAWNISGPMVDDGQCGVRVIDCNSDAPCNGTVLGRSCLVYPTPRSPLLYPAIACPPVANASNSSASNGTTPLQPVLRVFYGQLCPLWQDNEYNCTWDNIKQSFNGGGCVAVGDSMQCMCRHLTDFAAARKPKTATCSSSDMMSQSPRDAVISVKALFGALVGLFGLVRLLSKRAAANAWRANQRQSHHLIQMNLGALLGSRLDRFERASALRKLQSTETGFEEISGGVWTWTLTQLAPIETVDGSSYVSRGSGPVLARHLGIPFVRLRLALPEEMFHGAVGWAVGRPSGLSVASYAHGAHSAGKGNHGRMPWSLDQPAGEAILGTGSTQGNHERLTGTALVFAFLSINKALPEAELARRLDAARAYFNDGSCDGITHASPLGHGFDTLLALFSTMLAKGHLGGADWMAKARLWRLIFLQRPDGGWALSNSIAFSFEARRGELDPSPASCCLPSADDQPAGYVVAEAWDDDVAERGFSEPTILCEDCPLTCSREAVRECLPAALARLGRRRRLEPTAANANRSTATVPVSRVWATALALAVLEDLDFSLLVAAEPHQRTIVDAGQAYLDAIAASSSGLRRMLRSGELRASASHSCDRWVLLLEQTVGALRDADAACSCTGRASGQSKCSPREALAAEQRQVLAGKALKLWQVWMIICTLVLAMLFISTWCVLASSKARLTILACAVANASWLTDCYYLLTSFHGPRFQYSRATNCCLEVRTLLNAGAGLSCGSEVLFTGGASCEASFLRQPCLGFSGDCADLTAQFATLPGAYFYGEPPTCHSTLEEFECRAFPTKDTIEQALLSAFIGGIAVIVVLGCVQTFFEFSNTREEQGGPENWLELPDGRDTWNNREFVKRLYKQVTDFIDELVNSIDDVLGMISVVLQAIVNIALLLWVGAEPHRRWHYQPGIGVRSCDNDFVKLWLRFSWESKLRQALRVAALLITKVGGCIGKQTDDAVDGVHAVRSKVDVLTERLRSAAGLVFVYVFWGILSWMIFTCA